MTGWAGRTGGASGDGWIHCTCGARHWGRYGAAGLLLHHQGEVLLQLRAWWSHQGGTWGVPGGARHSDETALAAALREAWEEAGVPAAGVRPVGSWVDDHGSWQYTTVVAEAPERVSAWPRDGESVRLRWVALADVEALPRHPGFALAWPELRQLLPGR